MNECIDKFTMDSLEIKKHLHHRIPFILVDRVVHIIRNEHISAYKNITVNEDVFNGHFPGAPIFPGVLIVEALAQASGILISMTLDRNANDGVLYVLAGIDKVRFKRQVIPGDRLQLDAAMTGRTLGVFKLRCTASVDGEIACTTNIIICADRKLIKSKPKKQLIEYENVF